ncbi:PAS domain S-box protein [Sphingomonas sp. OTU376]|uniref:PAS domain S-box protein n=1 Tax=Sphingomonas sp. OTU376 TaxID=3043863 RepID=UPI00313E2CF9
MLHHALSPDSADCHETRATPAPERVRRLEALACAQARLAETDLDLDRFMQAVVDELGVLIEGAGVVIELLDGDALVYRATSHTMREFLGLRVNSTGSLSGRCASTGELLISNDTSKDDRVDREACARTGVRAMICAPLLGTESVRGVVKICAPTPGRFGEDDVQAARLVTAMLSAEMRKQLRIVETERNLEERTRAVEALSREVGERAALEASLRANEQRLSGIIGNAHQAIVTMTSAGVITCWNRQAELTFGWPQQEAVGRDLADLIVPADLRDRHRAAMSRFLATGEGTLIGSRIEVQALHRSGKLIPVELAINAAATPGGWEFTALLHDISERLKRTEQFENAFNHAPIGMAIVSLDGAFLRVNEAFVRIVGYSPDEIATLDFQTIAHPNDLEADLAQLSELIAGKIGSYKIDKRYLHQTGREVWVRLSVSMIEAEDGNPPHFIAQVEDLTSEREAENRYRLMARNSTDMITTTDLDGRVTFISPSCEKIMGLNPVDVLGRQAFDFVHGEDLPALRREYATLLRTGSAERVRWRSQRTDGEWIWLESSIGILHDAHDEAMTGFIDVVRDITDRKRREDALAAATLKAEQAVKSKSDFVANVSHELRTPLNSIIGFSRLLDEAPELSDTTRQRVRLVHNAGQALRGVIDNVLDFSKLEAEALELNSASFDLHDFIRQTVALMEPQAAARDIEIRALIGSDVPAWMEGDDARLRQVVLNLLSNAVKFTEEGSVTLTAWTSGKRGDHRLRVEVRDTGAGIPPEKAATLFNRFVQAGPAVGSHYGGTGLGLAISRQLIELMKGEMGLASEVGQGSTFWFEIPLCEAPPSAGRGKAERLPLLDFSGKRILVVDDVDLNRELMLATLSRYGLEVSLATNGAEAVDAVRNGSYDLVLMDCQMPVMDGFAATHAIRGLETPQRATPIVALTASAQATHLDRCARAGMDDQLTKPLDERQLERVLSRFLASADEDVCEEILGAETPAPSPKPSLEARYLARKVATLTKIAIVLDQGEVSDAARDEIQQLAHQLAGIAGMFGQPELGDLASKLDEGLEQWAPENRADELRKLYRLLLAAG